MCNDTYEVVVENSMFVTRTITVEDVGAMEAHKNIYLKELADDEEIKLIRNSDGDVVYGASGFSDPYLSD